MVKKHKSVEPAWNLEIFIPEGPAALVPDSGKADPSVTKHSKGGFIAGIFGREEALDRETMLNDWKRKLESIVDMASAAAEQQKKWRVEELEIGLTLSGEGKLLFLAKAGAQASVKVKLKRS